MKDDDVVQTSSGNSQSQGTVGVYNRLPWLLWMLLRALVVILGETGEGVGGAP